VNGDEVIEVHKLRKGEAQMKHKTKPEFNVIEIAIQITDGHYDVSKDDSFYGPKLLARLWHVDSSHPDDLRAYALYRVLFPAELLYKWRMRSRELAEATGGNVNSWEIVASHVQSLFLQHLNNQEPTLKMALKKIKKANPGKESYELNAVISMSPLVPVETESTFDAGMFIASMLGHIPQEQAVKLIVSNSNERSTDQVEVMDFMFNMRWL